MDSYKTYYTPLEAAVRWSNLIEHEHEILMAARQCPEKLRLLFPQWSDLQKYTDRIYDAIEWGDLPASWLGHPIPPGQIIDRAFLSVRHTDLRRWATLYYPEDRLRFLLEYSAPRRLDVSLGAHLCLQADKNHAERELLATRQECQKLLAELEMKTHECNLYLARLAEQEPLSEQGVTVKNRAMAALLQLLLGTSNSGQALSRFKSQAAIVDEIVIRHPGVAGLSKRSLDRHFAEANRSLLPRA